MTQAKAGDTVQIHYTGKMGDGSAFESSEGRDPVAFTIGEGKVLPALETAVEGMEEGTTQTVVVQSEEAFGPHRDELVQTVERSRIPTDVPLEKGTRLSAVGPDGNRLSLTVTDFDDETVTVDANHPLAGEDLTFEITLVSVGD